MKKEKIKQLLKKSTNPNASQEALREAFSQKEKEAATLELMKAQETVNWLYSQVDAIVLKIRYLRAQEKQEKKNLQLISDIAENFYADGDYQKLLKALEQNNISFPYTTKMMILRDQ